MLECRENVMFECHGEYRLWENKKRREIAGIWQCLLTTLMMMMMMINSIRPSVSLAADMRS